jgi:hypothetical protein
LAIKLEGTAHLTSNFAYLLLALLCVLLHPSSGHGASAPGGWIRMVAVDLPIFVATSVSTTIFYLSAQRELYPKEWKRDIWFFPFVLSLSVGLSINNAKAVLEAIFNRKSEFRRTPKYGVVQSTQNWRSSRYSAIRTMIPIVEIMFAIYFTYFAFHAFQNQEFLTLPFLMLFQLGFGYVAFGSIWSRVIRWPSGGRNVSVA